MTPREAIAGALLAGSAAAFVAAFAAVPAWAQSSPVPTAPPTAVADARCVELGSSAWPITASGRAQLLARAEDLREVCIEHAPFLALLGALWLEQGDPAQALLWLERALMLEPDTPATLADHALALAAMGERTAAAELLQRWQSRADVPAPLRARLEGAARGPNGSTSAPSRAAVAASAGGLTWRRNVSVFRGHESNLDHSPRLSELTLSFPDGDIDLPLAVPLEPRKGGVWITEGALQALYSTSPLALWQGGIQVANRHSPDEPGTDTRHVQVVLARWTQHTGWRSQVQLAYQRVTGQLNEHFNTYTVGAAAEREWNGCWSRLGIDAEWRRQDVSEIVDSQTTAVQGGVQCKLRVVPGWTGGLALRLGLDRPRMPARPGGTQQQLTAGLRAAGPLGAGFRLELSTRWTQLQDRNGYSPLLENDARRRQTQQQVALEISRPMPGLYVSGLDLVLQVQRLRQASNIKLFVHDGQSAFAGLRYDW